MPMVMRHIQGTKRVVAVPKAHTLTLFFKDDEGYPHTVYLKAHIMNNANPPRDNGKRNKRWLKRRSNKR